MSEISININNHHVPRSTMGSSPHPSQLVPSPIEAAIPTEDTTPATIPPPNARAFATFQPTPPLPTHITIETITQPTLQPFSRTIALLLPIRYPEKFYTEILSSPTVASLSRVAVWHGNAPIPGKRKHSSAHSDQTPPPQVVGGIRCRLETHPPPTPTSPPTTAVYIQALAVLSPHRSLGIATYLLEAVIQSALQTGLGASSIYAHVWEANTEGLEWYQRRGFTVEREVLEGYYRRLKPGGAMVVRRRVGVREGVRLLEREREVGKSKEREEGGGGGGGGGGEG